MRPPILSTLQSSEPSPIAQQALVALLNTADRSYAETRQKLTCMFIGFPQRGYACCAPPGDAELDEAVVIPGPGESHNPVILLVEDDVLVRFTTAEVLREAGFDVLEAVDSSEALALLTTGHPLDLIITDIRMPGRMDGVQLASVIKNTRPNLPIALLSSHLESSDHQADAFISKPYEPDRLVEVVKRLIGAEWRSNLASPNAS